MSIKKTLEKLNDQLTDRLTDRLTELTAGITDLTEHVEALRQEIHARFDASDVNEKYSDEILRVLPPPSGMTLSVLEALDARKTELNFSDEPLSDQQMSNLLHAADGINRKGNHRTTPTTLDWRENDIYVLKSNGIWRWVPERRSLLFCVMHDVRELACVINVPFSLPPAILVFVTDFSRTRGVLTETLASIVPRIHAVGIDEKDIEVLRRRATALDTGAKIQSVHLAAAAMGLACATCPAVRTERLAEALHLRNDEEVCAIALVGNPAKSLLDHIR